MTKAGRIGNVLLGIIIILVGILLGRGGAAPYPFIILILGITMIAGAVRLFSYYVTMARFMVDGKVILYRAVIILDVGLFTVSLTNVPVVFLVMYLAGIHAFSGIIDILRASEAKKLQAPSWKMNLSYGIVNLSMAILSLIFIKTVAVAVMIYAIGLIYSGVMRIIQAFRKTAVIYIQ